MTFWGATERLSWNVLVGEMELWSENSKNEQIIQII